jgi:hypothetical protein
LPDHCLQSGVENGLDKTIFQNKAIRCYNSGRLHFSNQIQAGPIMTTMETVPSFRAEAVQVERRFADSSQQKITKGVEVSGTRTFVSNKIQDASVASDED